MGFCLSPLGKGRFTKIQLPLKGSKNQIKIKMKLKLREFIASVIWGFIATVLWGFSIGGGAYSDL